MQALNNQQAFVGVLIMAAVTFLIRATPFWIFGRDGKTIPQPIQYLSRVLPAAMMIILIVYTFRTVEILDGNHGLPELIAIVVIVLLHLWKRNAIVSVLGGTATYMLLLQFVFLS